MRQVLNDRYLVSIEIKLFQVRHKFQITDFGELIFFQTEEFKVLE